MVSPQMFSPQASLGESVPAGGDGKTRLATFLTSSIFSCPSETCFLCRNLLALRSKRMHSELIGMHRELAARLSTGFVCGGGLTRELSAYKILQFDLNE